MTQSLEHDLKLLTYLAIIYPTMKEKLLDLTDLLAKRKDVEGLTLLRHITLELLSSGYEIKGLSLIELNEYIDEAQTMIKAGKNPEEILTSPIRRLID